MVLSLRDLRQVQRTLRLGRPGIATHVQCAKRVGAFGMILAGAMRDDASLRSGARGPPYRAGSNYP
jgi:hypothetical protein